MRQLHKQLITRGNELLQCTTRECNKDCFTLHSQWGSSPPCLRHQDPPRTQPAALPGTPGLLLLLHAMGCFLSPEQQNKTMRQEAAWGDRLFSGSSSIYQVPLTGWKKLAWAPKDNSLRHVSRFPVRTLECSCWSEQQFGLVNQGKHLFVCTVHSLDKKKKEEKKERWVG